MLVDNKSCSTWFTPTIFKTNAKSKKKSKSKLKTKGIVCHRRGLRKAERIGVSDSERDVYKPYKDGKEKRIKLALCSGI